MCGWGRAGGERGGRGRLVKKSLTPEELSAGRPKADSVVIRMPGMNVSKTEL